MEISIFGPGKGEAIAVHLGDGDWITVDSCKDQTSGDHALLSYLERIEVDVARQVRLVVGTHAHDDHIAGISEIYAAASDARFVTSAAIKATEFFAALEADADIDDQLKQAVRREYRSVFAEAEARGVAGQSGPIMTAIEQRVLWERPARHEMPGARVIALSPSDEAIRRSKAILSSGTAKVEDRRRLAAGDPNEYAVALWVEFGDCSALLGADLLNGPKGCGWAAVLDTHAPSAPASLYKVAHHGSPGADHPDVWASLLSDDVVSLLAPFRAGRTPRPSPDDEKRLLARSSAVFATARSKVPAQSDAVRKTKATLAGLAQNVREPYGKAGQVTARRAMGANKWSIDLVPPATQLTI